MNALQIAVLAVFIAAAVGDVYAAGPGGKKLRFLTTPILMPLLALFYLSTADEISWVIPAALAAGFIGDLCDFAVETKAGELAQFVAFMAAHLLYIIAFLKPAVTVPAVPPWYYSLVIPYLIAYILLFRRLSPYLGEARIPSAVYVALLFLMSYAALLRVWHYAGFAAWAPLAGSLLFIVSDVIAGIHRSKGGIRHAGMYIAGTYASAQALIVTGLAFS